MGQGPEDISPRRICKRPQAHEKMLDIISQGNSNQNQHEVPLHIH